MRTIHVIGCGKVGQTLARLWTQHRVFQVHGILNRSLESALRAAEFVGVGRAVERFDQLAKADLVMIATPDAAIADCCRQLAQTGLCDHRTIVFHCSGSLTSEVLEPARACGAATASLHPVRSFADPAIAAQQFAGTFCALEGDPRACQVLGEAMESCGARVFPVNPQFKTIYHAASVFACNYLVALIEAGLRCFEKAGIDRASALDLMQPLVAGTVENVFRLGPAKALTGPIARGEVMVVQRQNEALAAWDPNLCTLYKCLGAIAVELAAAKGHADPQALAAIRKILEA